ncbi:MAG: hypothetical protein ABS873_07040, partial [Alkalibacterium sp.]
MSQHLKELIKAKAAEIGIDKIGFTHAEPFYSLEDKLVTQRAKGHHSGFEHPVIEERIYPEKIFEEPKSIIAIALALITKEVYSSLFFGILTGALLYSNFSFEGTLLHA